VDLAVAQEQRSEVEVDDAETENEGSLDAGDVAAKISELTMLIQQVEELKATSSEQLKPYEISDYVLTAR
jgi:hypothetical protein